MSDRYLEGMGGRAAVGRAGGAGPTAKDGRPSPLVSNGDCFTSDAASDRKRARRSAAYRRRREAQERSKGGEKLPRTFWCGHRRKDSYVDVRRSPETGNAYYSGAVYCGAVWACPTCSALIRSARAKEVAQAVDRWTEKGGGLYMVTATIRHHEGDGLADSLSCLSDAWRSTVSGKRWKQFREAVGLRGYVRSLEITHGSNGWHPHLHFLFFVDGAADSAGAAAFRSVLLERWKRRVVSCGGKLPNGHGIDVRPVAVGDGASVAEYVSKVEGGGLALEMARSDLKESDEAGAITPFELLDRDDAKSRALWAEYVKATKGRRSVFFSRGLRSLLGMDAEMTDGELIAELEAVGEIVASVDAEAYEAAYRRDVGSIVASLELIERGEAHAAAAVLGCRAERGSRLDLRSGRLVECFIMRPMPYD